MNYATQQQLLKFVTEIASEHGTLSDRNWIEEARKLVAAAEKGGTIRDAIEDTKARFGHYAHGIYILEQALVESTVGKGGSCYVKPAHYLGEPINVCDSEGFRKARENDNRALAAFLSRPA